MRVLFLVPVCFLVACGGGGSAPTSDFPPPSGSVIRDIRCEEDALAGAPFGGLFSGEIVGVEGSGWATALLTEDGYFRLHIEDSLGDEAPELQFIGRYRPTTDNPWAWGEFRPQNCSDADPFCFAAEGQFELTSKCRSELKGTLVAYPEGRPFAAGWEMLNFTLEARVAGAYDTPATLAFSEGVYGGSYPYSIGAGPSDIVLTVDTAGAVFFQSPASGCVGNGTLNPHLDGAYNVYDVEITIANCAAASSHLNGAFTGLGTRPFSADTAFPADALLLWLSTPDTVFEQGSDPAMTLWLDRL
ncbi:MAG: hypothetical protein P8102_13140 [Gammaproteobacteria bacterium]